MPPLSDNNIDELATGYGKGFSPDVEAGLTRIRRRIAADGKEAVVRPLNRRRWLGAVAAMLLVAVSVFGFLYESNTVYANNGPSPKEFSLPDGTSVLLQSGAELAFAQDFNETERRVSLQGQAFFVVHKDGNRPFLVSNNETELRVTGTEFNLRVDEKELEVEVSEGSVELRRGDDKLAVKANECGTAKVGEPCTVMNAPHLNRHAWRTGKLYFQDAELPVVLEAIRTNFGWSIAVPAGCNYPVSGTFSTEDPEAILRNVARLGQGSVEKINGKANAFRLVDVCR